MTDEEMQKTMRFILEQQAQFSVDIQKLQETQAQTEGLVNRLAAVTVKGFEETNDKINALIDSHTRLIDSQTRLSESQAKTDNRVNALIDSHTRLMDSQARLSESQARLSESQVRTDEALRNLIGVVDRYFKGRNGG